MSQQSKIGSHMTTVVQKDNVLRVTYQSTDVVTAYPDRIVLDTGGWFTNTTKTKMNQASNQFVLGFQVNQKKGKWFVNHDGNSYEFGPDDKCAFIR